MPPYYCSRCDQITIGDPADYENLCEGCWRERLENESSPITEETTREIRLEDGRIATLTSRGLRYRNNGQTMKEIIGAMQPFDDDNGCTCPRCSAARTPLKA